MAETAPRFDRFEDGLLLDLPVTANYDANVPYPAPLRDLFAQLAQTGLILARLTETIHDEWVRIVRKNNPQLARNGRQGHETSWTRPAASES